MSGTIQNIYKFRSFALNTKHEFSQNRLIDSFPIK